MHYKHVRKAYAAYEQETSLVETTEISIAEKKKDKNAITALAFLREMKRVFASEELYSKLQVIEEYVNEGIFSNLTLSLNRLSRELNKQKKISQVTDFMPMLSMRLEGLYDHYYISKEKKEKENKYEQSEIITSATFE